MSDAMSFTVSYNLQLEDFIVLTGDEVIQSLMHDVYTLPDALPNMLTELQKLSIRVKELQSNGFYPEEVRDEYELKELRRLLTRILRQDSSGIDQAAIRITPTTKVRVTIMREILESIEFEEELEELATVIEDMIEELKTQISPF
jgi:hypothetical protein